MNEQPVLEEIATSGHDIFSGYFSYFESVNRILRTETSRYWGIRGIYDLYSEMEDKDAHLFSVLQTRKFGVLSRDREILPGDDSPLAIRIAQFVKEVINGIDSFDQDLYQILDAIGKGFAVLEIMWEIRNGRVVVSKMKSRPQTRFCFDNDSNLCLLENHSFPYGVFAGSSHPRTNSGPSGVVSSLNPSALPNDKFVVFTFNGANENPYGNGLCCKAYWYYWFKKNNLKFWVIFNEKFGSPTVVGKYKPGTSQEERDKLMDVVESLQNDTGVTIPENVMIEFLEARRTGSVNSYKDLADWCNDEISKLVLGETLTASEGRRSGSLALGRVHDKVRNEYIEFDSKALMSIINGQLIRYIVYFNFGSDAPLPKMVIDTSADEDFQRDVEVDAQLIRMGISLPTSYFYEKYRKPVPRENERVLRYDDNNLFQYHIQFGILTINEVRQTLGLKPVAWGDKPPARVSTPSTHNRDPLPLSDHSSEDPDEEMLVEEKRQ